MTGCTQSAKNHSSECTYRNAAWLPQPCALDLLREPGYWNACCNPHVSSKHNLGAMPCSRPYCVRSWYEHGRSHTHEKNLTPCLCALVMCRFHATHVAASGEHLPLGIRAELALI